MKELKKEKKKVRVFIGIPIERKLGLEIFKWISDENRNLSVRVIRPRNLHVTLVPPWYLEERNIKIIINNLTKIPIDIGKFSIYLNKVEQGPNKTRPRLIWALGNTPEKLIRLSNKVYASLKKKKEKREYKLHLTIARFSKGHFKFKINRKVNWSMEVEKIALYESRLSPKGAEYRIIKSFNF